MRGVGRLVVAALVALSALGLNAEAPTSGLYLSPQFAESAIVQVRNVVYSQRSNEGGVQATSDKRRASEAGAPRLELTLDVAMPPNATASAPQPLVIGIHGGGFYGGSKEDMYGDLRSYVRAGYVVASINYRLTPANDTSAQRRWRAIQQATEDVMNAIRFLKANADTYHIDSSRITTLGSSAGGGIALLNAVEFDALAGSASDDSGRSSKVAAAISTGATLGEKGQDTDSLLRFDANDSPVLLLHAKPSDSVTGATWSDNVLPTQRRFEAAGIGCTVVAQPDRVHTVSLALDGPYASNIRPFLWRHLRLEGLRAPPTTMPVGLARQLGTQVRMHARGVSSVG